MALSLKEFCKRVGAGYYSYRDLNGQMRGGGVNKKPKTPRPNIRPVATGRRDGTGLPKQRDIIEISMVKPALAAENIQLNLDILPVRTTREVGLSSRKLTL